MENNIENINSENTSLVNLKTLNHLNENENHKSANVALCPMRDSALGENPNFLYELNRHLKSSRGSLLNEYMLSKMKD